MGYSSLSGHAQTSATQPAGFGVCDRCGFWWNRKSLLNQTQWRGNQVLPIYVWCCPRCLDQLQPQLRPVILPPDPVPLVNPRNENFAADNVGVGINELGPPQGTTSNPVRG